MIEFRNVTKTYDTGTKAVKNANFRIDKGEFAFLVGSSGSGKSTLIKLILKEEEPTSGNIIINGKDTTFLKPSMVPYLRRSMGVVFQDFRLLPDKTVYDNVAYAMYIVRATPRHIRRQVPMVLSLVGLSGKVKMYPNELSGGEQQRVALARALVNNPSMLIADEPTGNLDPDTAWDIMTLLNDINMRGTTVVVATHAKDIVDKMKKRVIHIRKGEIIKDDKILVSDAVIGALRNNHYYQEVNSKHVHLFPVNSRRNIANTTIEDLGDVRKSSSDTTFRLMRIEPVNPEFRDYIDELYQGDSATTLGRVAQEDRESLINMVTCDTRTGKHFRRDTRGEFYVGEDTKGDTIFVEQTDRLIEYMIKRKNNINGTPQEEKDSTELVSKEEKLQETEKEAEAISEAERLIEQRENESGKESKE